MVLVLAKAVSLSAAATCIASLHKLAVVGQVCAANVHMNVRLQTGVWMNKDLILLAFPLQRPRVHQDRQNTDILQLLQCVLVANSTNRVSIVVQSAAR